MTATAAEAVTEAQRGTATPASFARVASWGLWTPAPHLTLLNYYTLLVYTGAIRRLMVFMPPRHGKSEFLSHYFAAWYLGRRPSHRIVLASYESDFAAHWGRMVRNTLTTFGPALFGVSVDPSVSAVNRWNLENHRGGMLTAGVGGPITGRGGQGTILDDPVKNDEQANSVVYRNKAWEWWRATFRTRLTKDPGMPGFQPWMIHVQTRWHDDDLGGRILNDQADQWTVLSLPAVAEEVEDYPLGFHREPGEPLWPAMYDQAALDELAHDVGTYWWAALFQQRPNPEGGGYFRRQFFRYWHADEDGTVVLMKPEGPERVALNTCQRLTYCDLAVSTKEQADYTVVTTCAITPKKDLIVLDVIRVRMEGPDQPGLIRQAFDRWKPAQIKVESVQYQLSLVQTLRRAGLPVVELRPDKDKVSRALVAAARVEGGTVYFPSMASWLGEWEQELLAFPNGAHDDQTDTLAYAALDVATKRQQLASW